MTVTAAEPPTGADPTAALCVGPTTVVRWRNGASTRTAAGASAAPTQAGPVQAAGTQAGPAVVTEPVESVPTEPVVAVADLVGQADPARRLGEWFDLVFRRPELLERLGAAPRLGVLVSGPEGVGKTTLVRAVAADTDARVVRLDGPGAAAIEAGAAAARVREAVDDATSSMPSVLLVTDAEVLLPASEPPPLATLVLESLRRAVNTPGVALLVTSSRAESLDPRLRGPDLVDRELTLPAPGDRDRAELLRVLLRGVPLAKDVDLASVGARTPGFVAGDLVALRREAAVRAALRVGPGHSSDDPDPTLGTDDLLGAVTSVRPASLSSGSQTLSSGGLTLERVGDMVETKQALTETVLWPLRYPDSFARLGVSPPRGVLLYGPPGCGKTFLVRALAGTGALNVFVVKGAEVLDKYVGESERAVRALFRRAAAAAPALVFLDEVDALAPRRGRVHRRRGRRPGRRRPAHRAGRGRAAARRRRARGHQPTGAHRPRAAASRASRAARVRAAAGRRRPRGHPARLVPRHAARRRRRPRRAGRGPRPLLGGRLCRADPRGGPDGDADVAGVHRGVRARPGHRPRGRPALAGPAAARRARGLRGQRTSSSPSCWWR